MTNLPRSNRREFLQGKSATDALGDLVLGAGVPSELPPPATGHYLVELSRNAMACTFEVYFNAGQYPHDTEAAVEALDAIDRIEDQLSVFRDHSETSRLNRFAGESFVPVSVNLFALVEQAIELHDSTEGAYDVTSGPLSRAWGFMHRTGAIPAASSRSAAMEVVGSDHLELDQQTRSIRFRKPGVEINFGSIGKGYALDCCAASLERANIGDFLLHGGNSSVLARGTHGGLTQKQGWMIGVRNPLRPERRLGQLRLHDRALATSGSGTQFFVHEGRRYGHILDPRSGWPAEGVLSASVLAPTAAEADALSTAFYVMGPERSAEYCAAHPQIAALILCPGARAGGIESHFFGLDPADWIAVDDS